MLRTKTVLTTPERLDIGLTDPRRRCHSALRIAIPGAYPQAQIERAVPGVQDGFLGAGLGNRAQQVDGQIGLRPAYSRRDRGSQRQAVQAIVGVLGVSVGHLETQRPPLAFDLRALEIQLLGSADELAPQRQRALAASVDPLDQACRMIGRFDGEARVSQHGFKLRRREHAADVQHLHLDLQVARGCRSGTQDRKKQGCGVRKSWHRAPMKLSTPGRVVLLDGRGQN
ncbi:hypothetical protein D3C83_00150 [compost metagenome]